MIEVDWNRYKAQIRSSNPILREEAVEILHHAGIRDDEVDFALTELLEADSCGKVRIAAVRFVSEIADKKFRDVLKICLSDPNPIVRSRAQIGLCKMK